MRKVVHIWFEKKDKAVRDSVMRIGLREVSRRSGISAPMLSRWLRSSTGMAAEKVNRLADVLQKEPR